MFGGPVGNSGKTQTQFQLSLPLILSTKHCFLLYLFKLKFSISQTHNYTTYPC